MNPRKSRDAETDKGAVTLSEGDLDAVSGGPNRRPFDHIGNFNFKVEIEGVTVAAAVEPKTD